MLIVTTFLALPPDESVLASLLRPIPPPRPKNSLTGRAQPPVADRLFCPLPLAPALQ